MKKKVVIPPTIVSGKKADFLTIAKNLKKLETLNYFRKQYNNLTDKKLLPIEALAILDQNRHVLQVEVNNQKEQLYKIEQLNQTIFRSSEIDFIALIETAYQWSGYFGSSSFDMIRKTLSKEQRFSLEISRYLEELEQTEQKALDVLAPRLIQEFEVLDKLKAKLNHLNDTISQIVNEGYPESLTLKSQVEESTKPKGRPLDKEASQKEIELFISELLNRAKEPKYKNIIHQSGKYKGKVNKEQIKEHLLDADLCGQLEPRSILRRIDKALKVIDKSLTT